MLSVNYPVHHMKAGQPTDFKAKLYEGEKIHTIRGNYEYWAPKIAEIQAGEAILSLRQWLGKPYCTTQVVIQELTHESNIGIQPLALFVDTIGNNKSIGAWITSEDGGTKSIDARKLVKNDGLTLDDFYSWFDTPKPLENPCIIHFTDFRY